MKPAIVDEPVHGLATWLDANAESIDTSTQLASSIVQRLAREGLLRVGVPEASGGSGGTTVDAVEAIASVARRSLAAAFVFWGQRTLIEYLLQSENDVLRERCLPALLAGEQAGATGLSNAMNYLSDIEPLQMSAQPLDDASSRFKLNGALPWITNLRREGFVVAAAFDRSDGAAPAIFAVPHDMPGVQRSEDLDLIALRASNTAALKLEDVVLDASWLIAADARAFLARARPAFLGLQCGMSIGLARRALDAVRASGPAVRAALDDDLSAAERDLDASTRRLFDGLTSGGFVAAPAALFEARIALAEVADAAVRLEVQASGGRGYLRTSGGVANSGVARRSREASFVPIVTPSVVQLKNQRAAQRRSAAA